jgi:hypothetical protein
MLTIEATAVQSLPGPLQIVVEAPEDEYWELDTQVITVPVSAGTELRVEVGAPRNTYASFISLIKSSFTPSSEFRAGKLISASKPRSRR